MLFVFLWLTSFAFAGPLRLKSEQFKFNNLDEPHGIYAMHDLKLYIAKTDIVSLDSLTPLELMNVLTETSNLLKAFNPLEVQWDPFLSVLHASPVGSQESYKIYPSMTTVVHPRVIRNMRPRNYRQLNQWADEFLQRHSIENILRWFDQGTIDPPK